MAAEPRADAAFAPDPRGEDDARATAAPPFLLAQPVFPPPLPEPGDAQPLAPAPPEPDLLEAQELLPALGEPELAVAQPFVPAPDM